MIASKIVVVPGTHDLRQDTHGSARGSDGSCFPPQQVCVVESPNACTYRQSCCEARARIQTSVILQLFHRTLYI